MNKDQEFRQLAIRTAEQSNCTKRKVGAVVVSMDLVYTATGSNTIPINTLEFDENNNTSITVIHAEESAINLFLNNYNDFDTQPAVIYVTQPPCKKCLEIIDKAGIKEIIIVEEFMKFDGDKTRYDLVPPVFNKAVADVLTYGAKKYKPRNYLECTDPSRFVAALYRHLEAYRSGEVIDEDSGHSHLGHAATNIAMLMDLEAKHDITYKEFDYGQNSDK